MICILMIRPLVKQLLKFNLVDSNVISDYDQTFKNVVILEDLNDMYNGFLYKL
jgi:hypothetical protein